MKSEKLKISLKIPKETPEYPSTPLLSTNYNTTYSSKELEINDQDLELTLMGFLKSILQKTFGSKSKSEALPHNSPMSPSLHKIFILEKDGKLEISSSESDAESETSPCNLVIPQNSHNFGRGIFCYLLIPSGYSIDQIRLQYKGVLLENIQETLANEIKRASEIRQSNVGSNGNNYSDTLKLEIYTKKIERQISVKGGNNQSTGFDGEKFDTNFTEPDNDSENRLSQSPNTNKVMKNVRTKYRILKENCESSRGVPLENYENFEDNIVADNDLNIGKDYLNKTVEDFLGPAKITNLLIPQGYELDFIHLMYKGVILDLKETVQEQIEDIDKIKTDPSDILEVVILCQKTKLEEKEVAVVGKEKKFNEINTSNMQEQEYMFSFRTKH